jgi:hypothetical protein
LGRQNDSDFDQFSVGMAYLGAFAWNIHFGEYPLGFASLYPDYDCDLE